MNHNVKAFFTDNGRCVGVADPADTEKYVNMHQILRNCFGNVTVRSIEDVITEPSDFAKQLEQLCESTGVGYVDDIAARAVGVYIEGDWKHDHRFFDDCVKTVFGVNPVAEDIVGHSDSDWYESVHYYPVGLELTLEIDRPLI